MNQNEFIEELSKLDIKLKDTQLNQLDKYYKMLVEYNKVMNLTGITEENEVYLKHFYDSITLSKIINLNEVNTLCDIGTGAGFPGLVLKIIFPHIKITLLDSLNKRVNFLNDVINNLNLKDIEVIHARAEEYSINHRNNFDVTTARAVAHLSVLLEYAIPMTKIGKYFVAMKSNIEEEINEIDNALLKLNTKIDKKTEFYLPIEESKRNLILFKKISDNSKYPRKYSEIKKNRL